MNEDETKNDDNAAEDFNTENPNENLDDDDEDDDDEEDHIKIVIGEISKKPFNAQSPTRQLSKTNQIATTSKKIKF
jgi:hypothetical protein